MTFYTLLENLGVRDFLSLVSVIITIYVTRYYYKYFTRVNPLPGPFPFPLVGNLPQLTYFKGSIKEFFEDCHRKYGDLFEIELGVRRVVFSRVEYIEKILVPSTKSQYMLRFPYTKGLEEIGMLGRGLLANNNLKSWKYNRQFFTQAILSPKFTREAIDWTNRLFNELEEYWDKLYLKEGARNELDFSAWINRYTNDMVIALLTGERSYTMAVHFNTKSDEKSVHPPAIVDDSERFVQAFRKQVLGLSMFLFVSPFVRHYVPVFKQISDDLVRNVKFIYERLEIIIKRRRQEIEGSPLDQPLPHDMLTSLITASTPRDINYTKTVEGEALRPMTDIEIRGIIHDGFLAGTDTTANMVTFIVYYLARHPDVKKKMLEEIDGIFQGDKTRPITENDFHNLKYCEAIAKEVNRVLPVFNTMLRHSEEPGEIAGYEWPAGTTFHVNAPIVHKHKDYWDEPERFNPDRWMAKGFEPKKHSFVMFGGGLRMCPGRKLAMIEMTCLMALLFRRYEIDLVDPESPLKIRSTVITTCPELFVKIRPRNSK